MTWAAMKDAFSFIGDICLFAIAVYTFRLTIFPKKLRFIGYQTSFSTFEGDSMRVTLENRSLSPVVVQSVQLFEGGYYIEIFNSDKDGDCIIDGFKTSTIDMNPFSKIMINGDEFDFHNVKDLVLRIDTPRGTQYIAFAHGPKKGLSLLSLKIKDRKTKDYLLKKGTVTRSYFNGEIVKDDVRYALVYEGKEGSQHTVFIHKNGIMSSAPFGYNVLPTEIVTDKAKIQAYFESEFSKRGILFGLTDLWERNPLYEIDGKDSKII